MTRDFPEPHGSIRYLEASTMPRTEFGSNNSASAWFIEVSTMTQAPRAKSIRQVLYENHRT